MRNQNNPPARYGAAFRLELRLICLHWSYALLHLLWALVLFSSVVGRSGGTAQWAFETGLLFVVRTLISGVALFLAANTFTRSSNIRFAAIEDTLPTGFDIWVGRWSACLVAVLAFAIEPAIIASLRGPFASFASGIIPFIFKLSIIFAFATALAWLLASLLGSRRWLFLVIAGVWVGLIIIPTFFQMSRVPFVGIFNLAGNGSPLNYTEVFGTMPQGLQPFWFHLFYAALLGVLLMAVLSRLQARRLHRVSRQVVAIGAAALVIALLALGGYSANVFTARAQEDYARAIAKRHETDFVINAPTPEAINRYDLTVDLTNVSTPRFTVEFVVTNRGETPLANPRLTLHHDLTITESSERYTRDSDFVTLTPDQPLAPGETQTIKLTYSGSLWLLDLFGGIPSANTFSNTEGVRLPYISCWYPVAGWVIPNEMYGSTRVIGSPAQITMKVIGAPGMTFASNLPATGEQTFAAQSAQWVSLVGSPRMVKASVGNAILYTAQFDQPELTAFVEKYYTSALAYIQRLIPDVPIKGLIVFGMERAPLPFSNTLIDGWMIVRTNRQWASYIDFGDANQRAYFISDLLEPLFPKSSESAVTEAPGGNGIILGYGANSGVMEGIANFIAVYMQANGDSASMSQAIVGLKTLDEARIAANPPLANPALTYKALTLQSLAEIYAVGGDAAIIRTLRQVRQRQPELVAQPSEKVGVWLREASNVP